MTMATTYMTELIMREGREAVCPVCRERFVYYPTTWAYKLHKRGGRLTYYCRYKCWREAARDA